MSEQLNNTVAEQSTLTANDPKEVGVAPETTENILVGDSQAPEQSQEFSTADSSTLQRGAYEATRRERMLLQREKRSMESIRLQAEEGERIVAEHRERERLEAESRKERAERLFALANQH